MGLAAQSSKRRLKSPGIINDLAGYAPAFLYLFFYSIVLRFFLSSTFLSACIFMGHEYEMVISLFVKILH